MIISSSRITGKPARFVFAVIFGLFSVGGNALAQVDVSARPGAAAEKTAIRLVKL